MSKADGVVPIADKGRRIKSGINPGQSREKLQDVKPVQTLVFFEGLGIVRSYDARFGQFFEK
jgi:hypothetical protein